LPLFINVHLLIKIHKRIINRKKNGKNKK